MRPGILMLGLTLASACVAPADAQLRRQLESGEDGTAALRYAARADVCGNETSLRVGRADGFGSSSWIYSRTEGWGGGECRSGPIVALITRAEGQVTSIRLAVGAPDLPSGTRDLGRVSGREAAAAFLDLASRQDGRVGREAILAAALADSAAIATDLIRLARSNEHSRGLRESAVSWLGRELARADAEAPATLVQDVIAFAKDRGLPQSVRSRAVSALRYTGADGTPLLVDLATGNETVVAKAAVSALAQNGAPSAREAIRRLARDRDRPTALRVAAIQALGNRDALPSDLEVLKSIWPTLGPDQEHSAVLNAIAAAGGRSNADWLLDVAGNSSEKSSHRARAVRAAERAGASTTELIRLYDAETDRTVKNAILEALGRIADREAMEKLESVASNDTDPNVRKSALRRLAQVGGDDARDAIESVLERP